MDFGSERREAPAIKCPNGHGLKLAKTSHNTCDRCPPKCIRSSVCAPGVG